MDTSQVESSALGPRNLSLERLKVPLPTSPPPAEPAVPPAAAPQNPAAGPPETPWPGGRSLTATLPKRRAIGGDSLESSQERPSRRGLRKNADCFSDDDVGPPRKRSAEAIKRRLFANANGGGSGDFAVSGGDPGQWSKLETEVVSVSRSLTLSAADTKQWIYGIPKTEAKNKFSEMGKIEGSKIFLDADDAKISPSCTEDSLRTTWDNIEDLDIDKLNWSFSTYPLEKFFDGVDDGY